MSELDFDQRTAVDLGPVDVCISAAAGSGKTRVLTERFVSAVLGAPPYEPCDPTAVVAVTFTEKAAGELAERIRRGLAERGRLSEARSVGEAWISTIHGMCARILRQHAFEAGIDPRFEVLDAVESHALAAVALSEAASDLLVSDDAVADLLVAYGYDAVARAVRDITDGLAALGLGPDDLATLPESSTSAALREAAEELRTIAEAIAGLGASATVLGNAESAREAAALLGSAAGCDVSVARGTLAGLDDLKFRKAAKPDGLAGLVEDARASLEQGRLALRQVMVRGHERALTTLVRAFDERFRRVKRERGALDFTDLQLATAGLLRSHPEVAAGFRERFAMVMVDEFQDTDELQFSIVQMLSDGRLCTVGDENQSIYSFRHADVEVFRRRARLAQERVRLQRNYRTAPELLDALNGLFSAPALFGADHVPLVAPPDASARRPWPPEQPRFVVRFCDATSLPEGLTAKDAEAECIAGRVADLLRSDVKPGDIAVLLGAVRGGWADAVSRALARRGIDAHVVTGEEFFDAAEVTEALALLRVVNNVRDDAALVTVLRGTATGLSDDALCALRRGATQRGGDRSLWNAAADDAVTSELPDADRATLARTVEAIQWARRQRGARPLAEMLLGVLLRLDVDLALLASGPGGSKAWANLTRLVRIVEEYEAVRSGDLGGLLAYLAELQSGAYAESGAALEGEEGAVRIMSIHAAKGLEFPVVIVGALDRRGQNEAIAMARVDGVPLLGMRLPDGGGPTLGSELVRKARKVVADAEEARLLHVACTRAEEALTLVIRSDPSADAGEQERMGARVRRAMGMAEAGSVEPGPRRLGDGVVTVEVVAPSPAPDEPSAAAEAECGTLASVSPPEPPQQAVSAPKIVSYSGLSLYETCPYRYYATAIARMPQPPTDSGADARAFGVAAHGLLARWASGTPVDAGAIAAAAAAAGLGAAEVPRLARAIEAFVDSDLAHEALSAPRVRAEVPIAVPVAGCVLAGAIDLLAEDGDEALIIDYKTGAGATDPAEASERYRLQGACYALAALTGGAEQVRVVFAEIETGGRTGYRYAAPDRPALEATVSAIIERMRSGEYAPRPAYDPAVCGSCPALGSLCPVTRRSGAAG